jgi:hypothetical protein
MMGPLVVGMTLVWGAWGLVMWRLVVEANRAWEVSDD